MKKAFVTVEAVIFIGIIFFIFTMSYMIYIDKMGDLSRARQEVAERYDCLNMATAMTAIHILGDGAKATVNSDSYMLVQPAQQRIEMNHTFCTFSIGRIVGKGSTLPFTLIPGNVTVATEDSTVEVIQ